jgi:hypothetical protein
VEASQDPDTATAQTIGIMCGHIKDAAADEGRDLFTDNAPRVQWTASDAAQRFGVLARVNIVGDLEPMALAHAAWWWAKTFIKFTHHESMLRERLGEAGHLQGLISPEVLVRMDRPEGDCAVFTECIAAFLRVMGVGYELVTVAVNPREPSIFGHVYLYALLPDGTRLPLDASHGDYPGWQVPSSHVSRRQVWDADGNPVQDLGSRFDGLHGYGLRGFGEVECPDGSFVGDGMLCTGPTAGSNAILPPSPIDPYLQPGGYSVDLGPGYFGSGANQQPAYTVPSQASPAWGIFANAMKSVLTIEQMNALKPGMVVNPNGQILQQNAGYAVPVGSSATINTALGGNTILYIGVAAVALLLFSSMKGGR